MAHYAFIDDTNTVVEVIPGKDETDTSHDWEQVYGEARGLLCKRTSYNGNIRKRYAVVGGTYDPIRDIFIHPQQFPSWTLNEETTEWEPPVPRPVNGLWVWDEESLTWIEVAAS